MSAEFIKMISELHEERFNLHLEKMVKKQTPCGIFFGFVMVPSNAAANVQTAIKSGLNLSCAIVLADIQANALRKFVDVPVITLEDFSHFGEIDFPVKPQEVFFIDTLKDLAFAPYLKNYGIESFAPRYLNKQNEYFNIVMKYLPEIYSAYEMLGSDESKKVFCAAIKGNVTGKISDYRFASEPQYFLEGFTPNAGDIAIDGGAYDGSTALAFAKCGAKVYAFEMDAANYKKCQARLGKNSGIVLENLGLGDKESEESYLSLNTASNKNKKGNLIAKFINLDTYVARNNLSRIDYIKLDIEGAELDMLYGAAKTISRCKPKMAVSAYHRADDLWILTDYIKSLRADYEFEFRHYQIDCTDYTLTDEERAILKYLNIGYFLPTSCEMVLYCR